MSIMRTLRKYNKHLLAVFVVGLMIAFIMPQTLRQCGRPDPSQFEIGKAFGDKILARDRRATYNSITVLRELAGATGSDQRRTGLFNVRWLLRFSKDAELDYLLLVREAQHMGLEVSDAQVDRQLAEWHVPAEAVRFVVRRHKMSLKAFRQIVADYIRVRRAFSLAAATNVSEPQLRSLFALTGEQMTAAVVPIRAEDMVDQTAEPTDTELAEHFGANQERFRFPDRIAVEYIELDVDAVKRGIKIKRTKARDYWQDHRNEFTEPTTQPATSSAESRPASRPQVQQLDFEQALPEIVEKLKSMTAREKAAEAISQFRDLAMRPWIGMRVDEKTGLREHPDQIADYKQLADEISRQKGVPVRYYRSELMDREQISELKGIGLAFIGIQQPISFADYAFHVAPLVTAEDVSERGSRLILVKDQDSSILYSRLGETIYPQYIFRVVRIDPSRLPKSLDEVKPKVIRDLKLDRAYENARALAEKVTDRGGRTKLAALADSKDPAVVELLNRPGVNSAEVATFSRRFLAWGGLTGPMVPGVTMPTTTFADRCFDALWSQPTTRPDGTLTCTAIEDSDERSVYVVQLLEKKPVDQAQYGKSRGMLLSALLMQQQAEVYRMWFAPENIHRRTDYHSASSETDRP